MVIIFIVEWLYIGIVQCRTPMTLYFVASAVDTALNPVYILFSLMISVIRTTGGELKNILGGRRMDISRTSL
jgi:uncharacterized membrane protein